MYPCVQSLYDCCWVSQPLQQLKNDCLGDSNRQNRLQRGRQFCKLSTKKQRDLQVIAMPGRGNITISINFTVILLLLKEKSERA